LILAPQQQQMHNNGGTHRIVKTIRRTISKSGTTNNKINGVTTKMKQTAVKPESPK
jgi:hypothetical protein